jgi:hypothetical protein
MLEEKKKALVLKVQNKIKFNSDYEVDAEYVEDLIDEAEHIILDWTKSKNENIFDGGVYDVPIIKYCIESINLAGLEGQSHSTANGTTKTFIASPESNLKSAIPQRM